MRARQQVSEVLADPDTDPTLAARLRTAGELLAFAEDQLGLPADDSYSSYVETGRSAVVWNVIATPEFSLEARRWCFAVAGCVPYRGYFDAGKAQSFADRLRSKGLDVTVRGATAYSTLGWFSDPLLDTMLRSDDPGLADTLFHELAHRRLYVPGDAAFNEAYASFVGRAGVRAWLASEDREQTVSEWQWRLEAQDRFNRLLAETRQRLARIYAGSAPPREMRASKERAFQDLRGDYRQLVNDAWNGRDPFSAWFSGGLNNADLALFSDYNDGICVFAALFEAAEGDFEAFHRLAAARAGLGDRERQAWLHGPCTGQSPAIAPADDL